MPSIQSCDEILIQVKTVGVCGSEVHAFHGTHPYRVAPVILGHEMAGDVVAVGDGVTRFEVGDRVVVDPQWACGECEFCSSGDLNLCPAKKVMGTLSWPGAFGEYVVAPEKSVFHLPDNLSYVQGSLIEPLTVAVHVVRRASLVSGESVAIMGTGSIGGLLAGVCCAQGASPIIAADIRKHCLDAARKRLGATHDVLLPDENMVTAVGKLTGGEGVDVVFVTADDASLVNQAVAMAKPRGRIVLVALLNQAPLELAAYQIIEKELQLVGSLMNNHHDLQTAIKLAASRQVDVEAIVTHSLPIQEAQRAVKLAETKNDRAIKAILCHS
jgi:L-iditol 2-dehydrogenase